MKRRIVPTTWPLADLTDRPGSSRRLVRAQPYDLPNPGLLGMLANLVLSSLDFLRQSDEQDGFAVVSSFGQPNGGRKKRGGGAFESSGDFTHAPYQLSRW